MSQRTIPALAAAVLLAGSLTHMAAGTSGGGLTAEHALGSDDAYISYRYAANLVQGHGLVFNPGEAVEGYSNLLFVLVAAALLLLVEPGSLYAAVCGLNLGLLLLAFGLVYFYLRAGLGAGRAAAGAVLLACCPPLWLWAASGMETIAMLALQVGLWIAVERLEAEPGRGRFLLLAGLLHAGVLLRADGFVLAAIAAAYFVLHRRWRLAFHTAAIVAPVISLHFLWRLSTYGELWPNTYYAKVSEPLAQRLAHAAADLASLIFAVGLAPYLLALLWVAASILGGPRAVARGAGWRERTRLPFAVFLPLALVAYWLYVGGDHFGERFLLVLFPLGAAVLLRALGEAGGRRFALLVALLVVFQSAPLFSDPSYRYTAGRYDPWVTLGTFLGERYPGRLLAVDAAGKIPYFSGLRTVDMRGLNDHHIARIEPEGWDSPGHNKKDPDYVLARRPDLIAAWILPDLDLVLGLDRRKYLDAGYRLRWLVNMTRHRARRNVADVTGLPEARLREAIQHGYRYAVLERIE